MADEPLDASPATAAPAPAPASTPGAPAPAATASLVLRPRRESFEHGLLPIPKLVFPEGTLTQTLTQLKAKLAAPGHGRVGAAALAEALQIPADQAALALGTLDAVLPGEGDVPAADGAWEADLRDVLLFLYIQSYKRLVPRAHKDSPSVADVWPSTSAFDGYLSALSPIQLVRSNSRRFMPSQADEEAHQLSYLQKHMANVLTLLADSVDGEGDESMVLTMETFEHLGFLLQFSEGTPLSQAAPFFANSDPDMPAAPVPATQVHEWILQNIASSLEYTAEKSITKENNQRSVSDPDVAMADAVTNTRIQSSSPTGASVQNNPGYYRNTSFVEGISKTSVVKHGSDIKGHSIKVLNCHDSVIYILAPLKYATVYGCSDITVVLGAIGKVVKVEHCERVQIVAASKRICIANCRECIFYLAVSEEIMAAAALRCPLLASPLPAAASCSGSSRPSRFLLRRRRCPRPLLAVSSDSSKPLASSSTGGGADPDEEPVLPLLQELADCLVLPPKFLSLLPRDLRLDLNDAAFDLSNGPVLNECGQEVGDLLLDLAKAWEMANTEASNNLAKQLPSMAPYLTASAKSAFGKRLASAGKKFQTMGQYGSGEFKKISETMIKIGKALSKRPVIQAEVQAMKEKRKLKFAGAEFELTAQNAYIGAAVGLVFGFFSWQLAQGVQSSPDDSQPLKVPLLLLGYTSTALSAAAAVGLVVLGLQMNPEDKSD